MVFKFYCVYCAFNFIQMKQFAKYILVSSFLVVMVSCLAPMSKKSYVEKFETFVNSVDKNHENYKDKDWKKVDAEFRKYNSDWYLKFKGEYTLQDQIKIKSLILQYHSYKQGQNLNEILNQLFRNDVDHVRKKVDEYMDNDMDNDFETLKDGAAEIGDSAVRILESVVRELDESF